MQLNCIFLFSFYVHATAQKVPEITFSILKYISLEEHHVSQCVPERDLLKIKISEPVFFIRQFMVKGDGQKWKSGYLANDKRLQAISGLMIYGRSLSQHEDSSEV